MEAPQSRRFRTASRLAEAGSGCARLLAITCCESRSVKAGRRRNGAAQIRQLEVRVRVHEPGQKRHMPQVAHLPTSACAATLPQPADPAIGDVEPIHRSEAGTRWAVPTGPSVALDWPAPRPDAMHDARCTMFQAHCIGDLRIGPAERNATNSNSCTVPAPRRSSSLLHRALCPVHYARLPTVCLPASCLPRPAPRRVVPAAPPARPPRRPPLRWRSAVIRGTACSRKNRIAENVVVHVAARGDEAGVFDIADDLDCVHAEGRAGGAHHVLLEHQRCPCRWPRKREANCPILPPASPTTTGCSRRCRGTAGDRLRPQVIDDP